MPTYEYACGKCGHEFEREQRITEDPVKTCPECRGRKVRRLISSTSFVLKGSGWYSDLYSSQKPDKKSDAGGDSAGAEKADGESGKGKDKAAASEKSEKSGKSETGGSSESAPKSKSKKASG